MRIKCEYKAEYIPIAHNMMFVALIKEALKESDEEYFQELYKYQGNKNNKKPKNFCFSIYMKDFIKEDNVFKINDRLIVTISSPDYEFMLKVYNGLLNLNKFKYKNCNINKVRISLLKEKTINRSESVFSTMSPICVKDKNNNMLDITNTQYEKELNYIVDKSLEGFRGYGLMEPIKFYPINMKKRVVKEDIRTFRENTNKQYYYVNSYTGIFKLQGNVKDLNDIYMLGIGFKRGQGFGMIELIE
ncbi:CRISPR-associated endoribonuclease Cas6 [Clostridium botulinum]|uniref:CRISPR-associated endoribonuclease Cas6 n=1 Tax=Clostridium botulinum TaxID=1491 RepID=UPI0006A4C75E|nr:CRISPR-associated endoribonuclease Cas6 [Clostridium botulinum]KOC30899.1 CRISPR-associated protein Cas6 [Clostridium botulinum]